MDKILPPLLKNNATIGFLSVAGDICNPNLVIKVKQDFEALGYNVKISETINTNQNYLCADDDKRAEALNCFFADKEIDAIIAVRGGYGSIRILDKIDYELVKNNPKIFCGYSDITALQLMMYKKTGLVTYNAPMILSDFASDISAYTSSSFWYVLKNELNEITVDNPKIYYEGIASGIFWGGNLSTIQSMCGLNFIPDEKFVFFAEDINEPVYKIDRMFSQLLNVSKFRENIVAIVLGEFSHIDNDVYFDGFFQGLANDLKIPIVSGLSFGHCKDKQTFPIGVDVLLDTHCCKILIT